jgi:hypothetical protein
LLTAVLAGSAFIFPDTSIVFVSFAATGVISLLSRMILRYFEDRNEPYRVRKQIAELIINNNCTKIEYEDAIKIRARHSQVSEYEIRYFWTGQTPLTSENVIPTCEGCSIDVLPCNDESSDFTIVRCSFEPIKRYRSRWVSYRIAFNEDIDTFKPIISCNSNEQCYSLFASITHKISLDSTLKFIQDIHIYTYCKVVCIQLVFFALMYKVCGMWFLPLIL